MGREKSQVRKKGGHSEEAMRKAIELVNAGVSIRKASKDCQLKYPTVRLYVKKYKSDPDTAIRLTPNYEVNMIFSEEEELKIKEYLLYCDDLFYGLSAKNCRRLAYQMAVENNIKVPQKWTESKMAGKEWLRLFRKRHPEISLRKPEACSLARATAFNPHNIRAFFDNLKSVMERHPSFADGTRVYNLDETSTSTVQRPGKILSRKGGSATKVTSGERGTLVTTCCIVSATGQTLPPAMVFPRKKFQPHMIHGAPTGTLGLAAPTGWMNAEIFIDVMKHFIKHVSASKENPALLIMDNHESHLSIGALELAKSSGVTILTLHPHTTAKLQPLDVGLNGPFKTFYNAAIDSWMLRNPGQPVTIYNVAECVGSAYMRAMTPLNIVHSFRKCGIFPFNDSIFTEIDFLPSTVTDRPHIATPNEVDALPLQEETPRDIEQDETPTSPSVLISATLELNHPINGQNDNTLSAPDPIQDQDRIQPGDITSSSNDLPPFLVPIDPTNSAPKTVISQLDSANTSNILPVSSKKLHHNFDEPSPSTSKQIRSPMDFMPPIKAKPRNPKRRRTPGKSLIATDTPEKDAIAAKKSKVAKKQIKKTKQDLFADKDKKRTTNKNKNNVNNKEDSDTSEEEEFVASGSSSGGEEYILSDDDDNGKVIIDGAFLPLKRDPKEQEYVVVYFPIKRMYIYYVAKILEIIDDNDEDSDFFVSFLRLKNRARQTFCEPLVPDTAGVQIKDVKYILPYPKITGSSRRQTAFSFDVYFDLSQLNLR